MRPFQFFFNLILDAQNENSSNKIAELKQEKQQMKEEIALLKLKIDVLLNMVCIYLEMYKHVIVTNISII